MREMTPREAADVVAGRVVAAAVNVGVPKEVLGPLGVLIDYARAVPTATGDLAEVKNAAAWIKRNTPGSDSKWHRQHLALVDGVIAHRCEAATVDAVDGSTPPAPEIVSGADAAKLPDGSWVIPCMGDGKPSGDPPLKIGRNAIDLRDPTAYHRVLDRATPTQLAVGDEVETAEKLKARAVEGTIIEDARGHVDKVRGARAMVWLDFPVVVRYVPPPAAHPAGGTS